MADYLANMSEDIAKRCAELEEEKRQAIMGKPLEEPTNASHTHTYTPETGDIGWPYGVYTSGYQEALNPYYTRRPRLNW